MSTDTTLKTNKFLFRSLRSVGFYGWAECALEGVRGGSIGIVRHSYFTYH